MYAQINSTYHGKSDICFLQCWTVIGSITSYSHHFSIGTYLAIYDALDQGVLIHRLGSGQDTKFGPDLIQLLLRHLD